MRKFKLIVYIMCVLLVVTGCGKKELTKKDFEKVSAGMSTDQLVNTLGKPTKIVTDSNLAHAQKQEDSDNNNDGWLVDDPDYYYKFAGGDQEDVWKLSEKMSSSDNLIYYHYEYGEERYQNVYIIDDEVVWMSFL